MILTKKICVIGCGVSGLSITHLLQQHGWKVTILSEADPRNAEVNPKFGSLFPAASVIPHTVASPKMNALFIESQSFFDTLYKRQFPGLKIHEHFELFAFHQSLPDYASLVDDFTLLPDFEHSFHPKHPEIELQSGWKFNCYFADWPLYYPALLKLVLQNGADLQIKSLQKKDLPDLPFDLVINCSELGAIQLFDDPHDLIYRGHLLQVLDAPALLNPEGKISSYNFSPGANIYETETGNPQDVYCYPRSDGWVLGGSRQKGRINKNGKWIGEENVNPVKHIDATEIPEQIYKLHEKIIRQTFGINIEQYQNRKTKLGYRYVRKKENGLRVETEDLYDKLFIHNYGHGGAGVTLSWGCALKVLDLLKEKIS